MANPKTVEARQAFIDRDPFAGFKISDNTILDALDGRHPCPECYKSRKFFCYTCYVPIAELRGRLPKVKVPIKIDIIKHSREIDGKSTTGHAAVLAPDDVSVYTYPDIPTYDKNSTVLIYPSQSATSIGQLFSADHNNSIIETLPKGYHRTTLMTASTQIDNDFQTVHKSSQLPIKKAIFIDSTWNQSKGIYKDERLRQIPCVVIQNRISQFWRHQKGSPRWYLATVEAIHQFLIELHLHCWGLHPDYKGIFNCFTEKGENEFTNVYQRDDQAYNGQYDDLLFFFHHMYNLIHEYYDHDNLYAYKRRLM